VLELPESHTWQGRTEVRGKLRAALKVVTVALDNGTMGLTASEEIFTALHAAWQQLNAEQALQLRHTKMDQERRMLEARRDEDERTLIRNKLIAEVDAEVATKRKQYKIEQEGRDAQFARSNEAQVVELQLSACEERRQARRTKWLEGRRRTETTDELQVRKSIVRVAQETLKAMDVRGELREDGTECGVGSTPRHCKTSRKGPKRPKTVHGWKTGRAYHC
jgi:hypothetical protein